MLYPVHQCGQVTSSVWASVASAESKQSPSHGASVNIWLFCCCCLVTKSCLSLFTPWTAGHQASLSFPVFQILLQLMSTESLMLSNCLILCHPLLLLPSMFASIRVFSNELALRIRWPKYWSFSISISPSNEYSGLISFRSVHSLISNKWIIRYVIFFRWTSFTQNDVFVYWYEIVVTSFLFVIMNTPHFIHLPVDGWTVAFSQFLAII